MPRAKATCPVCVETLTATRRFACPTCEYETCKACAVRYMTSRSDDAHCMNCRARFPRDVLAERLPQTTMRTAYRAHRESVLFERELSMMPATQPYVTQELQRRRNRELLATLQEERARLRRRLGDLDATMLTLQHRLTPPLEQERRQFVQPCAHAGCKGYLSSAWRCGICGHYTCPECNADVGRERAGADHACDPEAVETMKTIRAECRKCPGCAVFIQKISGCDAMWCVACHTSFSWRTGQKINGMIHNPHWYEYQRAHGLLGRAHHDVPCGGMPTFRELFTSGLSRDDELFALHRLLAHVQMYERPRYRVAEAEENVDLRVRYMLRELDEAAFKRQIQAREKAAEKKREVDEALAMLMDAAADLLRRVVVLPEERELAREALHSLVAYFNEAMARVSRCYNCVVPTIARPQYSLVHRSFKRGQPSTCAATATACAATATA